LVRSARVQEGGYPAEDTAELLSESERVFARLLELVTAVNRINSKTRSGAELAICRVLDRSPINIDFRP
jgi:hypothetical protein